MWRPNEAVEEDGSNLLGIDPQSKGRRSRRRAWRDGLSDQTVVKTRSNDGSPDQPASDHEPPSTAVRPPLGPWPASRTPALCFLRLSNLDSTLLDRVGRYETRLWRQAAQTIWILEPPIRQRLRHGAAPFTWDRDS
jgi:hypothetical protein